MKTLGHSGVKPSSTLPVCGVTAVAVVAGLDFLKVYDAMKKREGKRGNWKGRTRPEEIDRALKAHGVVATRMEMDNRRKAKRQTLKTFARGVDHSLPMILRTTGHIQVLKDGYVIDQTLSKPVPVSQYNGRNKYVRGIWMVWKPQ